MKKLIMVALCSSMLALFSFCYINKDHREKQRVVRIAKISVDPARLSEYTTALKEGMQKAVGVEPGVISYYAVADKKNPANITILEVYADAQAYESHIQTAHFKKYKSTTKDMIKSLELIDVNQVAFVSKHE